jgi:hypothetical protein
MPDCLGVAPAGVSLFTTAYRSFPCLTIFLAETMHGYVRFRLKVETKLRKTAK